MNQLLSSLSTLSLSLLFGAVIILSKRLQRFPYILHTLVGLVFVRCLFRSPLILFVLRFSPLIPFINFLDMALAVDLPPTINILDHQQRMRLVRSNRKLEAVLGIAPYYLESESPYGAFHDPISKARRRDGRIFGHSPSSSLSSASSSTSSLNYEESFLVIPKTSKAQVTKSKHGLELSRPVLLRLRTVPSDTRDALLPPTVAMSPTSPTFTIDLEKLQATSLEHRRKKMAKLARTLGVNVPPELVFPSPPSDDDEKHLKLRNIERKPIPPAFAPSFPAPNPAKPHPVISRPKLQSSAARSRPRLHIPPPPSAPAPRPPPATPTLTLAERRRWPRPRSLSVSTGTDMLVAAAQAAPSEDIRLSQAIAPLVRKEVCVVRASKDAYPIPAAIIDEKATRDILSRVRSPLPFTEVYHQHRQTQSERDASRARHPAAYHSKAASASYSRPAPSAFRQFGKRKELGWSGEWNQDMGHVAKALRSLKTR
ncbi:hypothetical protein DXG03_008064 [Asterophora parasitica]|uniref:Uncharacterized protein n=1 Tax=Asterophora parasitica TaxID=117018 RepID=A0A9P7G4E1_9AGAR|nr:hypothetical protein DXG03_008064 [Asterophora parasitica]